MAALAAIMFALLAMFIADSTPIHRSGVSVALPTTARAKPMPSADLDDAVLIAITKEGHVFLGSELILPGSLPPILRQKMEGRSEKKVYVKADRRAKVGTVNEVVNAIRSAGIENIAFLTEERKPQRPPAN